MFPLDITIALMFRFRRQELRELFFSDSDSDEGQIQILGQVHGRYVTLIVWWVGNDREQFETWAGRRQPALTSRHTSYLWEEQESGMLIFYTLQTN